MIKLTDIRYMEQYRTALLLERLVYPIALEIEPTQPATAMKLIDAVLSARMELQLLTAPLGIKSPHRKVDRALRAARCVRAMIRRLSRGALRTRDRASYAITVCEHLIQLLQHPV